VHWNLVQYIVKILLNPQPAFSSGKSTLLSNFWAWFKN